MSIKRVSLLLFSFTILIFIIPNVSATGYFTVEIYEYGREVIFTEDQTTQTIYMEGIVNYTGSSALGDTIELSSTFDLGESSISPENMVFHVSGSEEFNVELIIPNIYENGTNGTLQVKASLQTASSSGGAEDYARIIIINQSSIDDDNNENDFDDSDNQGNNGNFLQNSPIIMMTLAIVIIIAIIVIYKKLSK